MDIKIKQLQPSSDNYLSDSHFITHLYTLNAFVENFFTIDLTNYTIKLPKLKLPKLQFNTIVIPIRIISFDTKSTIGHTNVVVYDKIKCVINLFEPHGKEFMGYNPLNIDISGIIHYYINELFNVKATLFRVSGLQGKQNTLFPNAGHCTAWCLLFVEFKDLSFLDKKDPVYLDSFIRKYITFVKNNTKFAVSKINLDITVIKININPELIINYIIYLKDNKKHYELLSFKYYYTELFNKVIQNQNKSNFFFI
jgi:hypothetical protein